MHMKRVVFYTGIVIFSILIILNSCKKDTSSGSFNTELLTNGEWQLTGLTVNPAFSYSGFLSISNLYKYLDSCQTDIFFIFNTLNDDSTIIQNEGTTKCNASVSQTEVIGTWSLNSKKNVLIINDTTASFEIINVLGSLNLFNGYMNIIALTASTLQTTVVEEANTNVKYTFTLTFKNKN